MKSVKFLLFILSFIFLTHFAQAQLVTVRTVVPAAANYVTIDKTIWAWTVGEPVITTDTAGIFVFTQGFNQPDGYSISPQIPFIQDLVISPNPAHSNATLRFYLKADKPSLSIDIFDAGGKLYQHQELASFAGQTYHSLNPQIMASGTYMVRVVVGQEVYVGKVVIIN